MATLTHSDKLLDLFEYIVDKDDDVIADSAFRDTADVIIDSSSDTLFDALQAGADLEEDIEYLVVEADVDGSQVCYLFRSPGLRTYANDETRLYNIVMRAWCVGTGRVLKKKTKDQPSKST